MILSKLVLAIVPAILPADGVGSGDAPPPPFSSGAGPRFVDATDALGLGPDIVPETVSRACFADLNGDGWPDAVIDRHRVFLNTPDAASPVGRRFVEVVPERTGLRAPARGTLTVFADLDNDGAPDAIVTEYVNPRVEGWVDHGRRTSWQRGRGDGTFGPPVLIDAARPPPRARWRWETSTATVNSTSGSATGTSRTARPWRGIRTTCSWGRGWATSRRGAGDALPAGEAGRDDGDVVPEVDPDHDDGGRPTYGALIADLDGRGRPELLALSYGRRWNRLYRWTGAGKHADWIDIAPIVGFDGDGVRHGRHPEWLKERAKTDPRFDREDEKPFRANGNSFDAAVGDVDGDGDLDVFLAEITHAWAGESSDRSRLLVSLMDRTRNLIFRTDPRFGVDRIPSDRESWNQGDLFCALADLDHDGRLDLLLSSGDYPDDQRLRVFLQPAVGGFVDRTADVGLDHDGSQQVSLADVDGDGDLDVLVGQTFNRFTPEQKEGRSPRVRVFLNEMTEGRGAVTLRLRGDGRKVTKDALGAVVRLRLPDGTRMMHPLLGIGGHAGKQDDFLVHFGLAGAERAEEITVEWPDADRTVQRFDGVSAGRYRLEYGGPLQNEGALAAERRAGFAFLGLRARDIPGGHTVVSWILPGPLGGEGLTAPALDLARPDLLVAVDGESMDADGLDAYVRGLAPGVTIAITTRRSNRRGGEIPQELDHEAEERTVEVVLAARETWAGTIREGRGHDTVLALDRPPLLDALDPENVLGSAIAEHDLREPLERLFGVFPEWQEKNDDYHALSRVRAGFDEPLALPEIQRIVTEPIPGAGADPIGTAARLIRENLDAIGSLGRDAPGSAPSDVPRSAAADAAETSSDSIGELQRATEHMNQFLGDLAGDETLASKSLDLLRVPHETFYLQGLLTRAHVEVIRASIGLRFEHLAPGLEALGAFAELAPSDLEGRTSSRLPDALTGAVEGEFRCAIDTGSTGWVVVGGAGPNRYDLARVAAIVDLGGDDEYYATGLRLGCRAIVDLGGNDVYRGTPEQGAGAAFLGASLIDDRGGDDRYEGGLLSTGAAMFGVSMILDRAGNDTYAGEQWSVGAACYGAGMIVDLGGGGDVYLGDFLCQGVGGPRGFGAIVDDAGRDLYRANGPSPSIYGTPAVYRSFCQGIGFGFRHYTAGGIGLLADLGGDDRYEAGEFAQGGAYHYGLGILWDAGGRDLYYGNRYGQGFGVHQALGILVDEEGDDTYWSMTAASQGAAWDIGAGILLDRAGNDSYLCDGLGQGGASMQGVAVLLDLGGVDRYVARDGATQGESGGNVYHFHETGALSLSVLIDLGGDEDLYSRGRRNNATSANGAANEDEPANSSLHGLTIDR